MQTGQSIIVSIENGSLVCYPLLTRGRTYGALWMNIPESRGQNYANLQTLANQAAIALERSILLSESRQQAKQLEAAYAELEITYDQTLTSLMSALDARDRETEGHSVRVSRLTCLLAEEIGLNSQQLKALERGALLHDIGKIGITDTILHKPGKLTDDEWKTMRIHPDIGARIEKGGNSNPSAYLCHRGCIRCTDQQKNLSEKVQRRGSYSIHKRTGGHLI